MLLNFIDENNLLIEELKEIETAFEIGQNAPRSLAYDAKDYINDTYKHYTE